MAVIQRPNAEVAAFGHFHLRVRSVRRAPLSGSNSSILLGTSINSVWSAPRQLSWHFDILDILVILSKYLPLISIFDS